MPYSPPIHSLKQSRVNRKQSQKEYNRTKRKGNDFYHSAQWRKLRAWYVKQNPLCVFCKAEGRATPVKIVDHIIPLTAGGQALSVDNLQSTCLPHHNKKTAEDKVKYGA